MPVTHKPVLRRQADPGIVFFQFDDANEYDGVFFQPVAFDETSASFQVNFYYKKATVGSGTPAYTVKDTAGTTLVSG